MKHELYAPAASASTTKKPTRASQKDGTTISSVLSERPHTIGIVRMRAGRPDGLEHRLDGRRRATNWKRRRSLFFAASRAVFPRTMCAVWCVVSSHARVSFVNRTKKKQRLFPGSWIASGSRHCRSPQRRHSHDTAAAQGFSAASHRQNAAEFGTRRREPPQMQGNLARVEVLPPQLSSGPQQQQQQQQRQQRQQQQRVPQSRGEDFQETERKLLACASSDAETRMSLLAQLAQIDEAAAWSTYQLLRASDLEEAMRQVPPAEPGLARPAARASVALPDGSLRRSPRTTSHSCSARSPRRGPLRSSSTPYTSSGSASWRGRCRRGGGRTMLRRPRPCPALPCSMAAPPQASRSLPRHSADAAPSVTERPGGGDGGGGEAGAAGEGEGGRARIDWPPLIREAAAVCDALAHLAHTLGGASPAALGRRRSSVWNGRPRCSRARRRWSRRRRGTSRSSSAAQSRRSAAPRSRDTWARAAARAAGRPTCWALRAVSWSRSRCTRAGRSSGCSRGLTPRCARR